MAKTHKKKDAFLSHNSRDKGFAEKLKVNLHARKVTAWIDKAELQPGLPWPSELGKAIDHCKSVVVLIGGFGLGKWQMEEIQYAVKSAVEKQKPVIGVWIPGSEKVDPSELPEAITSRGMVDLRGGLDEAGMQSLVWGITGRKTKGSGMPAQLGFAPELTTGDVWLEERVVDKLKAKGTSLLDAYADLFSILSTDRRQPVHFEKMLEDLESTKQEKRIVASVSGFAGTGKSTFLICLHYAQERRYLERRSSLFPLFVNLRGFLGRCDAEPQSCPAVAREISLYIDDAISKLQSGDGAGILLIVDGWDEYYRHSAQSEIKTTLQDKLEQLSIPGKVVKVVGVGQGNEAFPGFVPAGKMSRFFPSSLIDLRAVKEDDPDLPRIIRAYVHVNGHPNEEEMATKLERMIKDLVIPEVDLFILSLLENAVRANWQPSEQGIGSLYFENCKDRVRKVGGDLARTDESTKKLIKILAEATFHIYVPEVKEFDQVVIETMAKYREVAAILPAMIAEIPHLHASVKEFLIAENAIEFILSRSMPLGPSEGAIYPYGINRFVKSIINRNVLAQNEILAKAQALVRSANIRQQIHLCYILGRFKDRAVRSASSKLLIEVFESVKDKLPDFKRLEPSVKSIEDRNWLLLHRTIFISLIYLGDQQAAVSYLMQMLEHPVCDNLNRGFHLQYYQDLPHPPKSVDMIEPDALDVEPLKTFEVLLEKLQADLLHGTHRPMSCVELFTLCSLCVNRHLIGKLGQFLRERLSSFLTGLKAEQLGFPNEAWPYIEMTRELVSKPSVSTETVFLELHALKEQPRAGWNATHKIIGNEHIRKCPNPESVSDHIWGAMLIASAFLPEHLSGDEDDKDYSKSRIIQMLLIHDLAETYLGDKPSFSKTEEDVAAEDRCMAKIIALSTLDVFSGILLWRGLWAEWRGKSSINAKIASDIDAIESYLQMRRYLSKPECSIPDADVWTQEVGDKLRSPLGKKIFASFRGSQSVLGLKV